MKIFQILHFAAGKAFCLISLGGASKGESAFIFFPLLCVIVLRFIYGGVVGRI
jgi:hypothetical protein